MHVLLLLIGIIASTILAEIFTLYIGAWQIRPSLIIFLVGHILRCVFDHIGYGLAAIYDIESLYHMTSAIDINTVDNSVFMAYMYLLTSPMELVTSYYKYIHAQQSTYNGLIWTGLLFIGYVVMILYASIQASKSCDDEDEEEINHDIRDTKDTKDSKDSTEDSKDTKDIISDSTKDTKDSTDVISDSTEDTKDSRDTDDSMDSTVNITALDCSFHADGDLDKKNIITDDSGYVTY